MEFFFENRNIKQAAALHFTTAEEQALATPFTFNTPGIVVPLGVDLGEFGTLPEPGQFRTAYPEIGDKRIILFLGRINFKKGLDLLAQAFARVVGSCPDLHLVIAGPDNEGWGARVRDWLREEGVFERVTFTGMLLGHDKLAAFAAASLFVLPSYSENFGIAVIEAMACGVPVVVTDKVNIWREVAAAEAGKVTPCAAGAVAQAMAELLDNPALAADMGRRGRDLVTERFQWPNIAVRLEGAYREIMAREREKLRL
jgi:glycosyltransferase involved in cell wall biosynthesis